MKKISGTHISNTIIEELRLEVLALKEKNIIPTLAVVLVGDDPASKIYVNNKKKACAKIGIKSEEIILSADISQQELLNVIDKLNNDISVHGILCQLPLPSHINEKIIVERIDPNKDIDGIHPLNLGRLCMGNAGTPGTPIQSFFYPCTPLGVLEILKRSNIKIAGSHIVVVGRGPTIGRPLSIMLSLKGMDATVTICHSKSANIKEITKMADILIAAIGVPKFITRDFVKEGAVVIDVGINRSSDNRSNDKIVGDVDYDDVYEKVSAITPVPGGVGPMTVAMLMYNTVRACEKKFPL
ncbi:MAG: bifunctional methylenetetrahydrofolate dehydrogenase/methenyltetrahydrofolate cyclohydrolase FolD [Oligoflexia bacterium]|nr:bifunctional methylenetetrahydrofolate dehydrogenase/methenyltetrahydrofolate cyclohydrolase FolD [Oligoflexia bacterium]